MKKILWIILCIACLVNFPCQASQIINPSFDCKLATTSLDKLICSKIEIQELDGYMSFYFQELLKTNPQNKNTYLAEQRNWLKGRKKVCAVSKKSNDEVSSCLKDLYRERNRQLFKALYNPNGEKFIRIEYKLKFFPFDIQGDVSKLELEQLYYTNQYPTFGEVIQPNPEEGHSIDELKNCDDNNTISVGSSNTYVIAQQNSIDSLCLTLKWLTRAKKPSMGLLHGMTISNIQYLPLDILPAITEDDGARIDGYQKQNLTLADLLKKDIITIASNSPNEINLTFYDEEMDKKSEDGKHDKAYAMDLYLNEIARGDFRGDGYDSILAEVYERASGTWSIEYMVIFTLGSDGRLVKNKITY